MTSVKKPKQQSALLIGGYVKICLRFCGLCVALLVIRLFAYSSVTNMIFDAQRFSAVRRVTLRTTKPTTIRASSAPGYALNVVNAPTTTERPPEPSTSKPVQLRITSTPGHAVSSNCTRVIPSILHYTWYSNNTKPRFRFHHVISVMSSLRFIKPQRIMFWHDSAPIGKWWTFIRQKINESTSILEMMQRDAPKTIFGRQIKKSEHHSDVVRLEAVMKYGGIYHDLDVVILRPLGVLYCYQMTMGEETPNHLGNGFFMSVANDTFLNMWHASYRTFFSSQWAYHSVVMPAIIAKNHPGLVHVEKDTIHKPTWKRSERRKLYGDGVFYNWQARSYAVHLWYRFHNVDYDPESIKHLNKTVGQIFRYIYYGKSDML